MNFNEWWKENGKGFSPYAIPDEVKWYAQRAWDAALTDTVSLNGPNDCPNVCSECGKKYHGLCPSCRYTIVET